MRQLFLLLYPYFRPYRRIFWTGVALMIIINIMTYIIPWGVGYIWDNVFPRVKEPGGIMLLFKWCGLLIAAALIRGILIYGMISCFWGTGTKVVRDLRNILYNKLQRLSFSFYATARTGDIMSRLTADLEMVRNFYAFMFEHRLQIVLYFTLVSGLLFLTDWKLALVCLAFTPVAMVTIIRLSGRMRETVVERQAQAGVLNAAVQENINGIRVVKAFGMEETEIGKFRMENDKMLRRNLNVSLLQAFLHPFLMLCNTLGVAAVFWYGGARVAAGTLTMGKFISFLSFLTVLNWPLSLLAPNTNQIRQAEGSTRRLTELLNAPEEIVPPEDGGKVIPDLRGEIAFRGVTFGYTDTPGEWRPVLREISLTVAPGEKVAVIGLTGSGKSTLINLIPRFYDPQHGEITVDGVNLKEMDLFWWRRQVGLVLQETFLFSASLHDNIAFGRPEATRREVEDAARAARIHDFIVTLPEGYDTVVGERGIGLSGGQKQRISIARALLMNPRVLILDDSTSSVDTETEYAIQQSLRVLLEGRTTILITQRLSTARMADRVVILESGTIRAQGTHEDLMDRDDFYRQLYIMQTEEIQEVV